MAGLVFGLVICLFTFFAREHYQFFWVRMVVGFLIIFFLCLSYFFVFVADKLSDSRSVLYLCLFHKILFLASIDVRCEHVRV